MCVNDVGGILLGCASQPLTPEAKVAKVVSSGLFFNWYSSSSNPRRETSSAAQSNTHGQGLRPNPAPNPPSAAHFGNRRARRRTPLRPSTPTTDTPAPSSPVLAPRALARTRQPGRQRGRGRARDPVERRPPRSTPAPAGASETGRVVRRENGGAARTSHGLPLTSGRRYTVAAVGLLLLPPLLLTSTSLCRKVGRAPRHTLKPNVVKGAQTPGTETLERERKREEARDERNTTSRRPEGQRHLWGRRSG